MRDWTTIHDLDLALDQLVEAGRNLEQTYGGLPFSFHGASRDDIARHGATLTQGIPPELARLYERIGGSGLGTNPIDDCHVFLLPLEETRWIENDKDSMLKWFLEKAWPEWFIAHFFEFGRGVYGDMLVYCPDPPGRTPGSIILFDHEGQGPGHSEQQPEIIVFLADSLAQWIGRWIACGLEEYGYVGATSRLPPETHRMLRDDHKRLNPGIVDEE